MAKEGRGGCRKQVPWNEVAMGCGGGIHSHKRVRPGADASGFPWQLASLGGGPARREEPQDLHRHWEQRPACTSFFLAVVTSASLLLFLL